MDKLVNQVQEQTQSVQQEVEKVVATGSVQLSLNGDRNFSACNASLVTIGDGRPNIFQVRTYANPESESVPALFFQGTTTATSVEGLVGQSIMGELFVALDNGGNVWQSDSESSAGLSIQRIDGNEIFGQLAPTRMLNPEGKEVQTSGPIRAILNR